MVRKNIPVNTKGKDLSSIGGRLAFEREELNYKIVDWALSCGVTKQTQIKYENGSNFPDARYFVQADKLGADVMYILTGSRTYEAISDEHQNLLEAYSDASPELKRAAFAVLLSPYDSNYERARVDPGYFRHEIKGDQDVRFKLELPSDVSSEKNS